MESENLGYPQGMEVNQRKKQMEQWPPLSSNEVTPKPVGSKQPVLNLDSGNQAGSSTIQQTELHGRVLEDDKQRKLELNDGPNKKWVIELKKEEIEKAAKEWNKP
uniref:Uncharacterized protein n=1 Tax=Solanum tuberosum TaxID=4113 RepID=M1DUU7_SOLTU